MDDQLEDFVTLLNRHRQRSAVPGQPDALPGWARRALSQIPEANVAPPAAMPQSAKPMPAAAPEPEPPVAAAPESRGQSDQDLATFAAILAETASHAPDGGPALDLAPPPSERPESQRRHSRRGRTIALAVVLLLAVVGTAAAWFAQNSGMPLSLAAVEDRLTRLLAMPPSVADTQAPVHSAPPPQAAIAIAPPLAKETAAKPPEPPPAIAPEPVPASAEVAPPPPPAPPRQQVSDIAAAPPEAASADPTWLRNAVPAPPYTGQPRVAIVIDDCGLDKKRTERAIALKGPVTLSFLAYAGDLPQQTEAAHRAGHELIVHVPMEPISRLQDMGPKGLAVSLGHEEILRRLRWDLGRFDGYVGINNHMGSRFTSDADAIQTVIEELKARGLLFLDSRTIGGSMGGAIAERLGVPTATRDVFLDDDLDPAAIDARLADLEAVARRRGSAIAIGHPHDQTLDALTLWLAGLPAKGIQLVPLTAIVKERSQHIAGAG